MIRNYTVCQCRTADTSLSHKKYSYLICQDPPRDDMDAYRGDIRVRVTKKVTVVTEDETKL